MSEGSSPKSEAHVRWEESSVPCRKGQAFLRFPFAVSRAVFGADELTMPQATPVRLPFSAPEDGPFPDRSICPLYPAKRRRRSTLRMMIATMERVMTAAPADDRALVERAAAGDSAAFGSLYQRYVDRVYGFVRFRVREESLAEDLTQEVFIQAMRSIGSLEWQGALAPWLMRIARNTVIDHWRKAGRRAERTLSVAEAGTDEEEEDSRINRMEDEAGREALERVEYSIDRRQIERASGALTEMQTHVLAFRFGAGFSIRETADAMQKSEGAVKNLQHHALRALRRAMEALEPFEQGGER